MPPNRRSQPPRTGPGTSPTSTGTVVSSRYCIPYCGNVWSVHPKTGTPWKLAQQLSSQPGRVWEAHLSGYLAAISTSWKSGLTYCPLILTREQHLNWHQSASPGRPRPPLPMPPIFRLTLRLGVLPQPSSPTLGPPEDGGNRDCPGFYSRHPPQKIHKFKPRSLPILHGAAFWRCPVMSRRFAPCRAWTSVTQRPRGREKRQDNRPAARPLQTGVFAIACPATVSCARHRERSVRRRRWSSLWRDSRLTALMALTSEAPAGAIGPSVISISKCSRELQDRWGGILQRPRSAATTSLTARISVRPAPDTAPNRLRPTGQGRASARTSGCSITQIESLTFRVPEYTADGIASLLANLGRQPTSPLGRLQGSSRVSWAGQPLSRFPAIPQSRPLPSSCRIADHP